MRSELHLLLLLAAAFLSCRQPITASRDGAITSTKSVNEPQISTNIVERIDIAEWNKRQNSPETKPPPLFDDRAIAGANRATIFWDVTTGCGVEVRPHVSLEGTLVRLGISSIGETRSGCGPILTGFKTVVTALPAGRYRIIDGERFDVLLTVPNK